MEKAYTETTKEVLGRPRKKKKPWISVESTNIIDQREETIKRIYIKHKVKKNQKPTKNIVCRKRREFNRSKKQTRENGLRASQVQQRPRKPQEISE